MKVKEIYQEITELKQQREEIDKKIDDLKDVLDSMFSATLHQMRTFKKKETGTVSVEFEGFKIFETKRCLTSYCPKRTYAWFEVLRESPETQNLALSEYFKVSIDTKKMSKSSNEFLSNISTEIEKDKTVKISKSSIDIKPLK